MADQKMLKWVLREVLCALPQKRDWLNPDAEREMRAMLAEPDSVAAAPAVPAVDALTSEQAENVQFLRNVVNDAAPMLRTAGLSKTADLLEVATRALEETSEQMGGAQVAKADYVLMPRTLTAENGAKGALSGEFAESCSVTCPSCEGVGEVDDGYECAECEGEGNVEKRVMVEWDTIKRVYARAVALLATPSERAAEGEATERKPLTYMEIFSLSCAIPLDTDDHDVALARAIEQHHGITGGGK